MQGLFLRALITGRLRTKNPVYLALMTILGLIAIAPSAVGLLAGTSPSEPGYVLACTFSPFALFGIGLLINVIRSM
jgi:hypothetical protein